MACASSSTRCSSATTLSRAASDSGSSATALLASRRCATGPDDPTRTCLLVGQSTLRRRIKLGTFAALDQRIALRFAMPPLARPTSPTISTCRAGRQLLSDDAAALIHQVSRGLPRAGRSTTSPSRPSSPPARPRRSLWTSPPPSRHHRDHRGVITGDTMETVGRPVPRMVTYCYGSLVRISSAAGSLTTVRPLHWYTMRIGVAGATGFIGQAITACGGAEPVSIPRIRIDQRHGVFFSDSVAVTLATKWCADNSPEYENLVARFRHFDVIINAAGRADPDHRNEWDLLVSNAVLPAVLALAARDGGVRRFLHISSAVVQGRLPLDDRYVYQVLSPYARSKAEGERTLGHLRAHGAMEVVIYRPPSVISWKRSTAAVILRIARLPIVPVIREGVPLPTALLENVATIVLHLASVENPAEVYAHPWEGMTTGSLLRAASGDRTPKIVQFPWLDGCAERVFDLLCRVQRIAPSARRAEILIRGQVQKSTLASEALPGFIGPEGYLKLGNGGRRRPSDLLRIAFVITRSDTIGGAHIHVLDMSSALISAGHDVLVLVGGSGPYTEALSERGVPYRSIGVLGRDVGAVSDIHALHELRRELKMFKPDLVSAHSSKAGVLGRIAARSLRMPVLFTAHGWAFAEGVDDRRRTAYAAVERVMANFASAIVCVSAADLLLAESFDVGRSRNRHLVRNGVRDIAVRWHADPKQQPMRAVMVARLDGQKDHSTLFAALAQLREPIAVTLIGDGPLESSLKAQCRDLGLHNVSFLGRRPDVHRVLADAQLFLLASKWEGLPRSIIEAMRARLPVIASDVGGVRELVTHGETGLLVGRSDSKALAQAIERLHADPVLRHAMGSAGRTRYEEGFRLSRLLDDTVAVYESVLGHKVRSVRDPTTFCIS